MSAAATIRKATGTCVPFGEERNSKKNIATADGGYLVVGERSNPSTERMNIWAVKLGSGGAIPGGAFTIRDDYQIFPNGSATSTDIGPLSVNTHSGNIFISDVKSKIAVQSMVPSKTQIYP